MDTEIIAAIILGAATIIAPLIVLLGSYLKRRKADHRKLSQSFPQKHQKQSTSADSTIDISIPGHIPRVQLPEFRTADSLQALREDTEVRQLKSEENQMSLWELPNGVFGYIEAYKIDTPPMRFIDKTFIENNFDLNKGLHLLQQPIFGDFVEIHKSKNGNIYLVGFVTEEDRIALQNPSRSESVKIVVSLTKHKKRNKVIAIHRERLEWWRHRELGDGECIGDARIS